MLQRKPLCACEITDILQLAASAVSQHLNILNKEGFIVEEKEGKWSNYNINIRQEPDGTSVIKYPGG